MLRTRMTTLVGFGNGGVGGGGGGVEEGTFVLCFSSKKNSKLILC